LHILNWDNLVGVHCGSVAIRNVANYYGVDYEEELCFGLGSGMGFFYNKNTIGKPSEVIHLRAPNMEPNFFSSGKVKYAWQKEASPEIAKKNLIQDIKDGFPVFLQTDIYYLDYYNSSAHFPGHVIVCMGVDEKRKFFYVSDTNFQDVQQVSFDDMDMARSSKAEPYPLYFNHFTVKSFLPFENLKIKIEDSILKNSVNYLMGQESERGTSSIFSLLEWASNLEKWNYLPDSSHVFRFAYQVIVKRGSKGAGFRFIYHDFLSIAEKESSVIKKLKLTREMKKISNKWNQIGLLLKEGSRKSTNANLSNLILSVKEVFALEYSFHTRVVDSLGSKKKGA
jgi:hypothetical protein|tara:strand:+ start:5946 stop:6959 length:1014 start_codon:yes stop_codon:yes gene_type:complete